MLPSNNIQSIVGATLYGREKVKIGRVEQVLVDATDGHPTWAVLHGGLFGRKNLFVPLEDATWEHDDVFVELDKDDVKHAPHPDADGGLSPAEEQELRAYYAGRPDAVVTDAAVTNAAVTNADARTDAAASADPRDTTAPPNPATTDGPKHADDSDAPKHAADTDAPEVDESVVLVQERLVVRTEQVPVARLDPDAIDDVPRAEPTGDGRPDPDDNRPGPDRIVI